MRSASQQSVLYFMNDWEVAGEFGTCEKCGTHHEILSFISANIILFNLS